MTAIAEGSRETGRDAELQRQLICALALEPLLGQCSIQDGAFELPRALVLFPEGAAGMIRVEVHAGAVILRGEVPLAAQREVAATIAARVPGCRAIINELRVGA
jgi:hypothetical protein